MADDRNDDSDHDRGRSNLLKCLLAMQITRKSLVEFVKNQFSQFQLETLRNIRPKNSELPESCNSCETCQLLPCPTPGCCRGPKGNCTYHTKPPRPCPVGICDKMKTVIEKNHQFGRPTWQNTDAMAWCTNSWQIAKCYMPHGFCHVQTPEETDFSGIITVINNCKWFDNLRQTSNPTDIFDQVNLFLI